MKADINVRTYKMLTKVFFVAITLSGFAFFATAQIDLQSNMKIYIGSTSHASRYTFHYGILKLDGGVGGSSWGWLETDRAIIDYGLLAEGGLTVGTNTTTLITGDLMAWGSKSFLAPTPTDASEFIRYTAMESGETLTIAQGVAKTVNGQAVVALPEHFYLVTNKNEPVTVMLTPESEPVLLYTKQKSTKEIVVAMSSSDLKKYKDVAFSYQVTGVRDGFEKQAVVVDEVGLNSPSPARADVQKRIDDYVEKKKTERNLERANMELKR